MRSKRAMREQCLKEKSKQRRLEIMLRSSPQVTQPPGEFLSTAKIIKLSDCDNHKWGRWQRSVPIDR